MEELVIDSKSLLNELSEQLLKKGKPIREIKDCFIKVGQEDDWHRTDYAKLWSSISLVQCDKKVLSIAKGCAFSFPHLSPFSEGVIAYSLDFPMKNNVINKLNRGLDRSLDKRLLPPNPTIQDLTKTDIENLFNYDLPWYGVGVKRARELVKIEGFSAETKESPMPSELQVLLQSEKNYPNKYAHIASFYITGDNDNSKSFYKCKETLEHLDSWFTEKLQIQI
jgi:hypothetical protein